MFACLLALLALDGNVFGGSKPFVGMLRVQVLVLEQVLAVWGGFDYLRLLLLVGICVVVCSCGDGKGMLGAWRKGFCS